MYQQSYNPRYVNAWQLTAWGFPITSGHIDKKPTYWGSVRLQCEPSKQFNLGHNNWLD